MSDPDVVIVGAGPSGAIAALQLARAGVRVHLLERASFPRPKLCGDTLNPGALALLDALGPGPAIRARALPVTGMMVTGPDGTRVIADYPRGLRGASLTRAALDLQLVEAAVDAGARFDHDIDVRAPIVDDRRVVGVRAAASGREQPWRARVVIAADGRASRLAAALRLSALARRPRRWAHGAYFTDVDGNGPRGEMHVRGHGYIGVAPVPGGLTNVCVVRERQRQPARYVDPAQVVRAAIAADAMLRERFARARQVTAITTLGPLAVESRGAGYPGLLLAGDAAGFVDPMTGDGLRFALRGGMLAADAALEELTTGRSAVERLAAARAREFAGKWRFNRALRQLVGSPRAVTIAAALASRWPAPIEYLVGIAGDVALADRAPHEAVQSAHGEC